MNQDENFRIVLPPLSITIKQGQKVSLEWLLQNQTPQSSAQIEAEGNKTPINVTPPQNHQPTNPDEIIAYPVSDSEGWRIEPASPRRDWMDQIPHGFAYRCLPLVMANQMGWVIPCPTDVEILWNGDNKGHGIEIKLPEKDEQFKPFIQSHFGFGILTFSLPWLFRTPPGIGLAVRGATNYFKFNAAPLDGFIETDWSPYTFTMNWKIIKPNIPVQFAKGDPICMIMPYPLNFLEQFQAKFSAMEQEPNLKQNYQQWASDRSSFNQRTDRQPNEWQKNYYGGKFPDSSTAPEHRTAIKLSRFHRDVTS